MAAVNRWSRRLARQRWRELGVVTGPPLVIGLLGVGLWPAVALVASWSRYENPFVAVGIYLVSLLIVGALCLLGPRGIGLSASAGAGLAVAGLNVLLAAQVAAGEPYGLALWLNTWGVAVPLVLALCRPVEEPTAILGLLTATNFAAVHRAGLGSVALVEEIVHMTVSLPIAAAGIVLAGALRTSVGNTRRARERAAELSRREQVRRGVEAERRAWIADWETRIAPVLEDVATGRRCARDPALGLRCRALSDALRVALGSRGESVLEALLPRSPDVELTIRDLDVGHRLVAADRVALTDLVGRICASEASGTLQLTLLADVDEPRTRAVAILAGAGLPAPSGRLPGTVVTEGPDRWWYDVVLRCEPAPALAAAADHGSSR